MGKMNIEGHRRQDTKSDPNRARYPNMENRQE